MVKKHLKRALAILLILTVSLGAPPGRTYASQSTRDKYNEATKNRDDAKNKVKEQQEEVDGLNARKRNSSANLTNLMQNWTVSSKEYPTWIPRYRQKNRKLPRPRRLSMKRVPLSTISTRP